MNSKSIIVNVILILLLGLSMLLVIRLKQPYGLIAVVILALTSTFNIVKKQLFSILIAALGILASGFILISGYQFHSRVEQGRDKFDITTAVSFETGTFNDVLEKSKELDKPIFIDFYTGWCGPCLAFSQNVLTDQEVGNVMNASFLNLKYDAEKGEGISLAKRFGVKSYPTLLVINHKGEVILNVLESFTADKVGMIALSKELLGSNGNYPLFRRQKLSNNIYKQNKK